MTVTVLLFAVLRERLGAPSLEVELPPGARVADLRRLLAVRYPDVALLLPRVAVAIGRDYAHDEDPLSPGAEIALIPPLAGGSGRLRTAPLSLDEVIAAVRWTGAGAIATFTGVVRDESRGRPVSELAYEAYPAMAEEKLAAVELDCEARWPGVRCAVRHRVGALTLGEAAVVIAVAAPHRKEAFAACAHAIDELKRTVPLWKHERGPDGAAWVEECVAGPATDEEPG